MNWTRIASLILLGVVAAPVPAQQDAVHPIRGFVYIEPFEMRFEMTIALSAVEEGQGLEEPLDAAARAAVLDSLGSRLAERCRIRVDGAAFAPDSTRVEFIRVDETLGPVADDRATIPLEEALVGAVFAAGRDDFPGRIDIEWSLFPLAGRPDVPVELEIMSGEDVRTDRLTFAPWEPVLSWLVPQVAPKPALLAIANVERETWRAPYVIAALLAALALVLVGVTATGRARDKTSLWISAALAALLASGVLYDVGSEPGVRVSEAQARGVIESLLTNIYFAFAFRDESVIFDTLAESVEGPLLEELYLDIRRGLELEDSGGPRVKVLRVALIDCSVLQAKDDGLRARIVWASTGDVSHWGHSHRRRNQYRGEFLIQVVDDQWKVVEVAILDEERT